MTEDTTEKPQKTRRERYEHTARLRVRRVQVELRKLARCGNRSLYEYSEQDASRLRQTLEDEVAETLAAFEEKAERLLFEV